MEPMGRATGKAAIATGAGRGLGEAIARLLAKEGAQLILTDLLMAEGQALERELGVFTCLCQQ
jgi:NAD(P)-dependent dehydrogenase (short-subunit alcohol dehydrogenase family)